MDFGINNFFDKKHKDSKIGHFQDLEHIDGLSISTISCGLYNKTVSYTHLRAHETS